MFAYMPGTYRVHRVDRDTSTTSGRIPPTPATAAGALVHSERTRRDRHHMRAVYCGPWPPVLPPQFRLFSASGANDGLLFAVSPLPHPHPKKQMAPGTDCDHFQQTLLTRVCQVSITGVIMRPRRRPRAGRVG